MNFFSILFRIFYLFCCFKLTILLISEFLRILIENFSWGEGILARIKCLKKQGIDQLNQMLTVLWDNHPLLHTVYLVIKLLYLLLTIVVYISIFMDLMTHLFH